MPLAPHHRCDSYTDTLPGLLTLRRSPHNLTPADTASRRALSPVARSAHESPLQDRPERSVCISNTDSEAPAHADILYLATVWLLPGGGETSCLHSQHKHIGWGP